MEEYFVEEKSKWDRILDFLVFLAVFAVTIFLILELVAESGKTDLIISEVNKIFQYINIVVFIIFAIDLARLWRQHNGFKDFMAHCWLDVLATIPFSLILNTGAAFEIVKLSRLAKLTTITRVQKVSRISKITKEFKAASHLKKEGAEYQRKHRL